MNRKEKIFQLAYDFREAIDLLFAEGAFVRSPAMQSFPKGSCGYVSDMLSEFLHYNGIDTLYVYGTYEDYSHAWLVDKRGVPKRSIPYEIEDVPQNIGSIMISYRADFNSKSHGENYEYDISDALIIDITGDQFLYNQEFGFYNESVYVGEPDVFHRMFETKCTDVVGISNDSQQIADLIRILDSIENNK